jgi:hypothetical protein
LVSAFATTRRLVLGQEAVPAKANELAAIPALLARLAEGDGLAPSSCWLLGKRVGKPRAMLARSSSGGSNPADVRPRPERTRPGGAVLAGGDVVAAEVEEQLCNSLRVRRLL